MLGLGGVCRAKRGFRERRVPQRAGAMKISGGAGGRQGKSGQPGRHTEVE